MNRRYDQALERCVAADSDRGWVLGDESLALVRPGAAKEQDLLDQLVLDLNERGVTLTMATMRMYREVAVAWPKRKRVQGASWSVHRLLVNKPSAVRPGMTVTRAHRALGQSTAGRTGPRSSVEARAEQVRTALVDPEVAEAVMRDVPTRALAQRAAGRVDEDNDAALAGKRGADRDFQQMKQGVARSQLEVQFADTALKLRGMVEALGRIDITGPFVDAVAADVERIDHRWAWIREALDNRSASMDAELAALLRE